MARLTEEDIPAGIGALTFKELHCEMIIRSWHLLHADLRTLQSLQRLPATAATIYTKFWAIPEIHDGFWKEYPNNVSAIVNAFVQATVEILS